MLKHLNAHGASGMRVVRVGCARRERDARGESGMRTCADTEGGRRAES